MKYLFLVLAGGIFWSSLTAYRAIGGELFGWSGQLMAMAVFLIVQGFELKPILLTRGHGGEVFRSLSRITAGKPSNTPLADPEELSEATTWAGIGYAIDFVCGLLVWPIVTAWDLLMIGGLTFTDINMVNLAKIIACVFLLQICIAQYLKRGGALPFAKRMGVNA